MVVVMVVVDYSRRTRINAPRRRLLGPCSLHFFLFWIYRPLSLSGIPKEKEGIEGGW